LNKKGSTALNSTGDLRTLGVVQVALFSGIILCWAKSPIRKLHSDNWRKIFTGQVTFHTTIQQCAGTEGNSKHLIQLGKNYQLTS